MRHSARTGSSKVPTCDQPMPCLRMATFDISLRICTLIVPPSASKSSAQSALATSSEARYNNTLLSKNGLSLIGLFAVELEVPGDRAAQLAHTREHFLDVGLLHHGQHAGGLHVDFDFVPVLQLQRLDHGRRQAHRQAVAPFGDFHDAPPDIRSS